MTNNTITCAREGCEVVAIKKTHNQKYCSDGCCKIATNERLMVRYYARKARRSGAERLCIICEDTKLSRYNNTDVCGSCEVAAQEVFRDSLLTMFSNTNLSA
jgi:hypothetical protein